MKPDSIRLPPPYPSHEPVDIHDGLSPVRVEARSIAIRHAFRTAGGVWVAVALEYGIKADPDEETYPDGYIYAVNLTHGGVRRVGARDMVTPINLYVETSDVHRNPKDM